MSNRPARARREFHWNAMVLADPDPDMSVDEVLAYYAEQYPELTTAVISGVETIETRQVHRIGRKEAKRGQAATPTQVQKHTVATAQGARG